MNRKKGKRYRSAAEKLPAGPVPMDQAITAIQSLDRPKFDPTVELVMHLGIDPKQADQAIRGAMSLPHGIGATRKVIAFCENEDVEKATAAGAMEAGCDELIEKIQGGWLDFDVAVATKAMMKRISRLGRILGPQGKMPSPKAGTVADDVAKTVGEYAAGKAEFRSDEGGNVHAVVGKASFEPQKLRENVEAFVKRITEMRPATTKGTYVKKVCLCTTMSPSVQVSM